MPFAAAKLRAIIALCLTQMIGWGGLFWLPAITGPRMAEDLGLNLSFVMSGTTIMLLVMAFVALPIGRMMESIGTRRVMLTGGILGTVGLLALACAQGAISFSAAWLLIGLAGAMMLSPPSHIAMTEIAEDNARGALSILMLTGGLSSSLVWPLAAHITQITNWRVTTLVFGLAMLLICLPLFAYALKRQPPRRADAAPELTPPPAIDRTNFILVALSFAFNGFVTWGFALTLVILFDQNGLSPTHAVLAATLVGFAQWAGRLLDLFLGRYWSSLQISAWAFLLFPLSFLILMLDRGFMGALGFAALYGSASGIVGVARATVPLAIFPRAAYARASSRLALPLNIAFAISPPIFTLLMMRWSTDVTLWLAVLLSCAATASFWMLYRRLPSTAQPLP